MPPVTSAVPATSTVPDPEPSIEEG